MKNVMFVLLAAVPAWAGPESSGGGNAVVCFSQPGLAQKVRDNQGRVADGLLGAIETIEAFDLHEAGLQRGFAEEIGHRIIRPAPTETPEAWVERITRRLDAHLPSLSERIRAARAAAERHGISEVDEPLERINDRNASGLIDLSRCAITTMAMQTGLQVDDLSIRLDRRLYAHPRHGVLSRGVLLLHEYVYALGRSAGHTTSRNTRKLVGELIFAKDAWQLSVAALSALARNLDFPGVETAGHRLALVVAREFARVVETAPADATIESLAVPFYETRARPRVDALPGHPENVRTHIHLIIEQGLLNAGARALELRREGKPYAEWLESWVGDDSSFAMAYDQIALPAL
jgi:hypothetical protein